MQSHNEVLEFIRSGDKAKRGALSIAPQTLASLSAAYAANGSAPIPLLALLQRIRHFLGRPENGGWQVCDTTFARHMSLLESVREFKKRRKEMEAGEKQKLPMLTSACPGWVCYAEKAQGDLLPLMSNARSAQGVMGALVKHWWGQKEGLKPNQVYHVTAMPCYDKKLEASREDFYDEHFKTRETDCVLTTGELDLLLHELGFDPYVCVPGEDVAGQVPFPDLLEHPGSSSGSYLATLMTALAVAHGAPTRIHERQVRNSPDNVEVFLEDAESGAVLFKGAKCYGFRNLQNLVRKVGRETGIGKARTGTGRLQAAVAARRRKARTGAGEIQTPATPGTPETFTHTGEDLATAANVAARDEKKLDFVEVMACPGGCVNGGGQMKPAKGPGPVDAEGYPRPMADDGVAPAPLPTSSGLNGVDEGMRWSTKEWVERVEDQYWAGMPSLPVKAVVSGTSTEELTQPQRMGGADELASRISSSVPTDLVGATFSKVESDVLSQGGLTHEQAAW